MLVLSASTRQGVYAFLGLLNAVLLVCVQQNAFADAPKVAHCVALSSLVLATVMKSLFEKDTPKDPPPAEPPTIGFKQ